MAPGTASRSVTAVGLCVAGIVVGHAITYAGPSPGGIAREAWLMTTGHGYLSGATHVGSAAALILMAAAFLRGLGGRALDRRSLERRLIALQLTGFLLLEVTERLVAGTGYADLPRILPVGLAVQVVVAVGLARAVRLAFRTGTAVAARLSWAPVRQVFAPVAAAHPATPFLVGRSLAAPVGGRAPPASL